VSVAARVAVGLVVAYQRALAPFLPRTCRFAPTCSEYARLALIECGLVRGAALAAWRLLRCHPFHPGGYDPPPAGAR
jgi:putative membrane protein insertion efficiency factor